MSFLFPSFLWGIIAIAIPIAIHIFNFRKTKRIYFSNISFLRHAETQTKSIRKIKEWLILLARIFAIICLVLAFAQPFIPTIKNASESPNGITSFYLDNSMSMQSQLNTKRYIDVAIGKVDELLGKFKYLISLQLITNDFSANEIGLSTSDQIRDRLTTLQLNTTAKSLQTIYNRQHRLIEKNGGAAKNQLFWFSDFQKSTVGEIDKLKIDTTDQLYLIPVQSESYQNIYLDSVWLNNPFIRELQNNSLYVNVRNSGNTAVENLILKLTLNNTQSSTASVNIAPNGHSVAKFNFNINRKGLIKGKVSFDDFPVIFDNDFYFVLNASPRINIQQITETNGSNTPVSQVYSNDSLFNLNTNSTSSIDLGLIKENDLMVLNGVTNLNASLSLELQKFVNSGGSLVIIPQNNQESSNLSPLLKQFGINIVAENTSTNSPAIPIKLPDSNSPFYEDVFEQTVQDNVLIQMPSATPLWKWSNTGVKLLEFSNGAPFLSQIGVGSGKVYLFAGTLSNNIGNLAQHALFVPTMYKMAASSIRASKLAYTFQENPIVIALRGPKHENESIYKLKNGENEIIPIQRIVRNQLYLEIPNSEESGTLEPGYFDIIKDGKTLQTIALNIEPSESNINPYTVEELGAIFKDNQQIKILSSIDSGEFETEFTAQHMGNNLWKYFLIAALFFLFSEIILIRFLK
mgnify:CR=1 FL=1